MILFRPNGDHSTLRPTVHLSQKKEAEGSLFWTDWLIGWLYITIPISLAPTWPNRRAFALSTGDCVSEFSPWLGVQESKISQALWVREVALHSPVNQSHTNQSLPSVRSWMQLAISSKCVRFRKLRWLAPSVSEKECHIHPAWLLAMERISK